MSKFAQNAIECVASLEVSFANLSLHLGLDVEVHSNSFEC